MWDPEKIVQICSARGPFCPVTMAVILAGGVLTGHHVLMTYTAQIYAFKLTGWAKKRGRRLMTIILSNLNRLKKFTGRFLSKFAVKWIFKKSHRTLHVLLEYLVKH